MARKQRRQPETGMYEDEHYRADVAPSPGDPIIEIYSKPHQELVFKASREGLFFWCKRCRESHLLSWDDYFNSIWSQVAPLRAWCPLQDGDRYQVYILRTLTNDATTLIARLHDVLTGNNEENG